MIDLEPGPGTEPNESTNVLGMLSLTSDQGMNGEAVLIPAYLIAGDQFLGVGLWVFADAEVSWPLAKPFRWAARG